ncbi:MAG: hypothetical protein Q7S28_03275 [bacterium]|nr:hypothetical protein [bacterium]
MPSSQKINEGFDNERGEMKQAVRHSSPKDHYKADVCIVWCFDKRFASLLQEFVRVRGFEHFDQISVAGGAKALAAEKGDNERTFVMGQIEKSIKLHHTARIILMTHSDCGAYGGLKAFGTEENERAHHVKELRRAAKTVTESFPGIPIERMFADFEGLHETLETKPQRRARIRE